ncbi:MAG: YlxR family protein [Clostridia bacterium]
MAVKKIPMRMCLGCREMKAKKELVRVVKAPTKEDENGQVTGGEISLDLKGKKPGRGAYICKDVACLLKAKKQRSLERAFSTKISDEIYDNLQEEISE